jgi:hypothetical protein
MGKMDGPWLDSPWFLWLSVVLIDISLDKSSIYEMDSIFGEKNWIVSNKN